MNSFRRMRMRWHLKEEKQCPLISLTSLLSSILVTILKSWVFLLFFLSFGSVMKQKNKVGSPQLLTVKIGLVKIESPTN